jgi:protein TonB
MPGMLTGERFRGTAGKLQWSPAGGTPFSGLFANALLDVRAAPAMRSGKMILSFAAHIVLLLALVLIPLFIVDGVDLHRVNRIDIVTAPEAVLQPAPPLSTPITHSPGKATAAPQAEIFVPSRAVPQASKVPAGRRTANDLELGTAPNISVTLSADTMGAMSGIMASGSRVDVAPGPGVSSPAVSSASNVPLRVGGSIHEPRLLWQINPAYPAGVRKARIQGDVVLEAVINTKGDVVEVRAVSGNTFLFRPAIDAVSQWKYEPTILDGQAFPVRLRIIVSFRLKTADTASGG